MKTNGTCEACEREFSKLAMTKHLVACPERPPNAQTCLHVLVEGNPPAVYWMHLAVKPGAKLADLDRFLRAIWLECCDHLSAFRIAEVPYFSSGSDMPGRKMNVPLANVLRPGLKCGYEYDFGSTTALRLRVVGVCGAAAGDGAIRLLARNNPPPLVCDCGTPATEVCTECACHGDAWLCAACAAEHACGEELLLPVVNSPRVGVCGYTG
jgi:hypothetical protein